MVHQLERRLDENGPCCPLLDASDHYIGADNRFAQVQQTLRLLTAMIHYQYALRYINVSQSELRTGGPKPR